MRSSPHFEVSKSCTFTNKNNQAQRQLKMTKLYLGRILTSTGQIFNRYSTNCVSDHHLQKITLPHKRDCLHPSQAFPCANRQDNKKLSFFHSKTKRRLKFRHKQKVLSFRRLHHSFTISNERLFVKNETSQGFLTW